MMHWDTTLASPTRRPFEFGPTTTVIVNGEISGLFEVKVPDHVPLRLAVAELDDATAAAALPFSFPPVLDPPVLEACIKRAPANEIRKIHSRTRPKEL